ncbi:MAG TPA: DUF3251 domain-containing protein [Nitrospirota bacterium]|nr:DUF3251 domain-containing protein [Nitrospirota bacterium]
MKMNVLGLCALCVLASCDSGQQVASLEKKLNDTQAQLSALQSSIEALKKDIHEVKDKQASDELVQEKDWFAYLTPGSNGYSVTRFDLGFLIVRLVSIKPYAHGSKVTLEIGNPSSVAINRLNATVDWGKVDDKGVPLNEHAKSKEVTLKQSLQGGYMTKVPLILEGIPPKELGFVRVKQVSHGGIRFLRK